ncbi:MAG: T9SS type A sorting domain-containing protein, partial [Salibacteraceae bacterium]|nr:T9SS type A sorting domain-containing protein [Salibacteraceae bacterium]
SAQIFDIVNYDDTLVFGSNFRISSFSDMWNIDAGRALGVIHADKSVTSKSFINGLVNSLTINGNGLLEIGGDFTSYIYQMPGSTSWIQNAEESLMMAGEIAYGLVGTEEIVNSNDLIVYPNPTSGILNLSSTENIQKVNVYDLKGSLILERNASQLNAQTLDVSSLKSGVYVIELVDQTGSKLRNEFVVN